MPSYTYSYNGFTFPNANLQVEARPTLADDGATQNGTIYHFTITGILSAATQSAFNNLIVSMKCALSQPRQTFLAAWTPESGGTVNYYNFGPADDVEFGPKPGPLTLGKVSGGLAAIYGWSLEVRVKECFGNACAPQGRLSEILSLTRQYQHEVDDNGFTRRTVSGRLEITAKAINTGNVTADSYRGIISGTIPQPKGYIRQKQQFECSKDGRVLDYSFVDQEVMWTFPQPITSGRASFSIRASPMDSAQQFFRLQGRFGAPASVGKAVIVQKILDLAVVKIPFANPKLAVIVDVVELTEDVYGNAIDFLIQAHAAMGAAGPSGVGMPALEQIGGKPTGSTGQNQLVSPFGGAVGTPTSGTVAAKPSFNDACVGVSAPLPYPPSSSFSLGYDSNNSNNTATATQPPVEDGVSPGHQQSPYLEYQEQFSYQTNNNISMFNPKLAGQKPILQQCALPYLTVTQAGYAVRAVNNSTSGLKNIPTPPPPILADKGAMLQANETTVSSEPISTTNWDKYTIRWHYVMRYTDVLKSSKDYDAQFPDDPRRAYSTATQLSRATTAPPELVQMPA